MSSIKDFIKGIFYILFRIFPIQKKKIFFNNYFGRGYGCNPKYICEALHRLHPDYDLVWEVSLEHQNGFPDYVRIVKLDSPKAIFERVTSKVWVQNTRCRPITKKRKGQFYIQTWHGAIGIKKCEGDAGNKIVPKWRKIAKHDSPMIDLMISNSRFCTDVYKRGFWYNGEIAEIGYPRNDLMSKPSAEIVQKVREFFHIKGEKKILLYAPTFRKDNIWDSSSLDVHRALNSLQKKFGGDWVCLMRLHPWAVKACEGRLKFDDTIINASKYPDIQELLAAADSMITDYSSCQFDFLIQRKPTFMFATDIDSYINERGLLFDPFKLPFSCSVDNDSLEKNILDFDTESYLKKVDEFFLNVQLKDDGHAATRAAEIIVSKVQSGE